MEVLKAADHKSGPSRRQWAKLACDCLFIWHFWGFSTAAPGLMVLAAAFVPSQPLFNANGGLLGTVISVWSHPFSFEQCT
jgi:hypothetical protein